MKGTNGIIAINEFHDAEYSESDCIRCMKCVEVCPMGLMPLEIDLYYRLGDMAQCKRLFAQSCINCGCCSYECPAKRRLAEHISDAGKKIKGR
jgi:electron transport complex protein RnfC